MKFECHDTGQRRPVFTQINRVRTLEDRIGDITDIAPAPFQKRYELALTVKYSFWANPVQLPHMEREAMVATRVHLFKDMLPIVTDLIVQSQNEECREAACKLKDMMLGRETT